MWGRRIIPSLHMILPGILPTVRLIERGREIKEEFENSNVLERGMLKIRLVMKGEDCSERTNRRLLQIIELTKETFISLVAL